MTQEPQGATVTLSQPGALHLCSVQVVASCWVQVHTSGTVSDQDVDVSWRGPQDQGRNRQTTRTQLPTGSPGGGGDGGVGQGGRQVQRPRGWHLRLTDALVFFSPDSSGAFDDILGKSRLGGALTLPPSPDLSSVTQFCLLLPRKHPPFWGSFQKGRSYAAFCLPQHSGIRVPLQLWKLRLENEGPQLRLCRGE